jgi:hypothetical protein
LVHLSNKNLRLLQPGSSSQRNFEPTEKPEFFSVDKVLKKEGRKLLVSYLYYPKEFNLWIDDDWMKTGAKEKKKRAAKRKKK